MNKQLAQQILATYRRHGWELRRALFCPGTSTELATDLVTLFSPAPIVEADFDALWFARPSHRGREAWELRLLAETPYALFEAFEANESEEQREDVRREMEARMGEHLSNRE